MSSAIVIGDEVQATEEITEAGFNGADLWVHATPGAFGQVQQVDGDYAVITWEGAGRTTDCHRSQFVKVQSEGCVQISDAGFERSEI